MYELTPALLDFLHQAEQDRLPKDELISALAAARAGCAAAATRLERWLRHLVFEIGNDDTFGIRFAAYMKAMEKLMVNTVEDPVAFVTTALWRAEKERQRQDSPNVLPKRSTNSRRRKKKQPEHPQLQRQDVEDVEGGIYDVRPRLQGELSPTKTEDSMEQIVSDLAADDDERSIMELLSAGYSQVKIAATLGKNRYEIEQAIKRLKERAERAGYEP